MAWPQAGVLVAYAVLLAIAGSFAHAQADPQSRKSLQPQFLTGDRIAAPAAVAARQVQALGIRAESIRLYLSVDQAYPSGNIGLQCQGANDTLTRSPVARVSQQSASTMERGRLDGQRFGPAIEGLASRVFRLSVDSRDVLPEGVPPRCEVFGYPTPETALPDDAIFWFAVSLWIDDWKGTNDEQIVTQWHQNDPRLSLNPFLAVVVRGDQLRLELRTSAADPATRQDTTTIMAASRTFEPRQWMTLVFKSRLAPPSSGRSELTLWIDGQRVAHHVGDLGYRLSNGAHAYAKAGIYKWLNGNPWNTSIPTRTVAIGRMLLVSDPAETYLPGQIRRAAEVN